MLSSAASTGTVTGLVTLAIDAEEYDDASATVLEQAEDGSYRASSSALGDWVEVYDSRGTAGQIAATRVSEQDPTADKSSVYGTASAVTSSSFKVGALTVNYSASILKPAGTSLVEGQNVRVWASTVSGLTVTASSVAVQNKNHNAAGSSAQLSGLASNYVVASSVTIAGVKVLISTSTAIENSSVLANGAYVRAHGVFNETGDLMV